MQNRKNILITKARRQGKRFQCQNSAKDYEKLWSASEDAFWARKRKTLEEITRHQHHHFFDDLMRGDNASTATTGRPAEMSWDTFKEAARLAQVPPPFPRSNTRIIVNPHHPKHQTRTYTVRYDAHPLIQFLALWFPIKPYIDAEYPDDDDPWGFPDTNTLVCGERHYELMK